MPLLERVQIGLSVLLCCVVLAGLVARRRAGACWSFVCYLSAVALSDALIALWPERFWQRDFWILKESVHNLLKLAMALELTVRIFEPFPSAYAAARRAILLVVIALAALVAYSLSRGTEWQAVVGRLYPHVNDGTVWLLVAVGGYCVWYHLPLDSLHKAILIGLVPYLLVYSVVLRAVASLGWERSDAFNRTAPIAYLVLLGYWAHTAWRRRAGAESGERVATLMARRQA